MKKIISSIFLILICYLGYSQTYPVTQNLGNTATTKVKTNALEGKLIITAFTDTVAANTEGYLKNYDGAIIKTTSPINALWYRVLDSAKWVQLLPLGGGTGGTRSWLDGGNFNVLADGSGNAVWGTLQNNGIKMTTNATTRLLLDKGGIVRSSGAANKFLTFDTTTKTMYYTDGASASDFWSTIGNSGTTPPSSFIGTTDAVDLVTKTNGTERSRWNTNGALAVGSGTDYGTAGYVLSTNGSSTAPTWVNPSGIGRRFGVSGEDATAAQNRLFINSGYAFQLGAINGNKEQLFRSLVDSTMGMYLRDNTSSDLAYVYLNGADSSINLKGGQVTHGTGLALSDAGFNLQPFMGLVNIDSLNNVSATTQLMMVRDSITGDVYNRAIPTSGSPSLTSTYIGYGDGSNLLTGTSGFTYDVAATTGSGLSLASSAITSGALATFTNTGTAAASNTKTGVKIVSSGANASASQTTYGMRVLNTNTGTLNNNIGIYTQASGAASNNLPLVISESGGNYNNNGWAFESNSATIALSGTKTYINGSTYIMPSTGVFRWVSGTTNPFGTTDLGISRVRANVLGIGTTSTSGDTTGSISLTNLYAKGSVGIGTTSPNAKLHVLSTATTGIGSLDSTSTLTTGSVAAIKSTSTVVDGGSGLNISMSGANSTASKTVTGQTISVTNTGTTNTNVGLNVTASGASTRNTAIQVTSGIINFAGTGTAALPNIKFGASANATGFYDAGVNNINVVANANLVGSWGDGATATTGFWVRNTGNHLRLVNATYLTSPSDAVFKFGLADAAAPVAQNLKTQNVVAGTSNTAGVNLTIDGSQGTGTGVGGSILFRTAAAGSTGTAVNALATTLTISPTAITAALPVTLMGYTVATLPTGVTGMIATVNDSNTNTWGATIAGSGANTVLAFFNGTNWTVIGQ